MIKSVVLEFRGLYVLKLGKALCFVNTAFPSRPVLLLVELLHGLAGRQGIADG